MSTRLVHQQHQQLRQHQQPQTTMQHYFIYSLLAFTVVSFHWTEAHIKCLSCSEQNCEVDPKTCLFGTASDHCGRTVCAKGPQGRCGGIANLLGTCGENLRCACNRCTGCYKNTDICDPIGVFLNCLEAGIN